MVRTLLDVAVVLAATPSSANLTASREGSSKGVTLLSMFAYTTVAKREPTSHEVWGQDEAGQPDIGLFVITRRVTVYSLHRIYST